MESPHSSQFLPLTTKNHNTFAQEDSERWKKEPLCSDSPLVCSGGVSGPGQQGSNFPSCTGWRQEENSSSPASRAADLFPTEWKQATYFFSPAGTGWGADLPSPTSRGRQCSDSPAWVMSGWSRGVLILQPYPAVQGLMRCCQAMLVPPPFTLSPGRQQAQWRVGLPCPSGIMKWTEWWEVGIVGSLFPPLPHLPS